jgi:hypothetical protein
VFNKTSFKLLKTCTIAAQCLGDTNKIKAITDYVSYLVLVKNANANLQNYFGATALAMGM